MENNDYYVYMYLREKDSENGPVGSPYYIGKGRAQRAFRAHRVRVPKDLKLIVLVKTGMLNDEAMLFERELIQFYGRINISTGCLANLTDGGEGNSGWKMRDSTREKIRAKAVGRLRSEEACKKHAELMTGEWNPFFGKTHTEETRQRWSQTRKGKPRGPMSVDHKRKIAAARLGIQPWNKGRSGVQDYSDRVPGKSSSGRVRRKRLPVSQIQEPESLAV